MAKICINELSNYNNGELVFKWFDLDDYYCASDFWESVNEWLESCTNHHGEKCEEWILGDVDEIPQIFWGEYHFHAEAFYEYKDIVDQLGVEKIEAFKDVFGYYPEYSAEVEDKIFMTTGHSDDTCKAFYHEIGSALVETRNLLENAPEEVSRYFDYVKYGQDHYDNYMGMSDGFVFWV